MSKIFRTPMAVVPNSGNQQGFPEIGPDDFEQVGRNALESLKGIVDDYILKGNKNTVYGGDITFVGPMRIMIALKLHGWRGSDGLPFYLYAAAAPEFDISPA